MFARRPARITTGAQIRAARALLAWTRQDLAAAARLHPNAVAYWERHAVIPSPPDGNLPFACRHIAHALRLAGVVMVSRPGPGVALKADETTQKFEALYGEGGTAQITFAAFVSGNAGSGSDEQLPPS
jgi:DNA-binding XRE family transcriptional regulator